MDLPINIALKRPVFLGENTYDKLSFDEPDLACQIAYAEREAMLRVVVNVLQHQCVRWPMKRK
ncbi:MAG: hypothetical protein ACI92Z_002904 [Paracoccaceae bacterium]|jgi:hypothetical protein